MITAELSPNSYRPVELLRWTDSGKVQVVHRRLVGDTHPAIFAIYSAVPPMKIIDSDGRDALVAKLRALPRD